MSGTWYICYACAETKPNREECPYCGYDGGLIGGTTLEQHPWQCPGCADAFTFAAALATHLRDAHATDDAAFLPVGETNP